MKKAPDSYHDSPRPDLPEALSLEGGTLEERIASLVEKGYFYPQPRPWSLGRSDRGLGRGDYAILDKFGKVVVEFGSNHETASAIIEAINAFIPENRRRVAQACTCGKPIVFVTDNQFTCTRCNKVWRQRIIVEEVK